MTQAQLDTIRRHYISAHRRLDGALMAGNDVEFDRLSEQIRHTDVRLVEELGMNEAADLIVEWALSA